MLSDRKGALKCGNINDQRALAVFTTTASGVLVITTVLANGALLYAIFRNRRLLMKQLFYQTVSNIIVADFLTGLITESLTFNYVLKESLGKNITSTEIIATHVAFFTFASVSVLTVGILSVERLCALLLPMKYRIGIDLWKVNAILASTWVLSAVISFSYTEMGFFNGLIVFASSTVALSFCAMILTVTVFYFRLIRNSRRISDSITLSYHKNHSENIPGAPNSPIENRLTQNEVNSSLGLPQQKETLPKMKPDSRDKVSTEAVPRLAPHSHRAGPELQTGPSKNHILSLTDTTNGTLESKCPEVPLTPSTTKLHLTQRLLQIGVHRVVSDKSVSHKVSPQRLSFRFGGDAKRVTKSFILMLFVFLITYLPTCAMMVYMNSCKECNCLLIHVLRDLTNLSMNAGALVRAINFMWCLKPLKGAVLRLIQASIVSNKD